MSSSHPPTHALWLAIPLALGCQAKAAEEQRPPAEVPTTTNTIPVEDVSGTIAGEPFAIQTARYFIDRRPRYEKLEIQLLGKKLDKTCDNLGDNHTTMVWLRRTGPGEPQAETLRFGPDDEGPWEAHYERFSGDNWTGSGKALALLGLSERAPDLILRGELYACFGDRTQSCVMGRFAAVHCPIRIDALVRGTDAMERPPPRKADATKPASTLAEVQENPAAAPARP
jgi:hypothetical protein